MRAIMVMYDSLNRNMLEPYGCDWTRTPNFRRLAEKSVRFENCYVGSMPCMPARRELHTGRVNFFHRSWGPLEPFDDSMPEILKNGGIYTHLVSDHQHYWEDGGATYHNRYRSWEISRGQEGDLWKSALGCEFEKESVFEGKKDLLKHPIYRAWMGHDQVNRSHMEKEEMTSQAVTFANGLDFIKTNQGQDNWFLQIETFDPHEPFYTLPADRDLYPYHFTGDEESDWPPYARVRESEAIVRHVRCNYGALVSKCDRYLGKVLDMMDEYDMWKDTMLIVNTDHGFLLGEHGWWGKSAMPIYDEIAHTPLFIHDPRIRGCAGEKRSALVQTIDLAPTILEFFGKEIPKDMEGKPLRQVMEQDIPVRDYAVFGYHGSQVNVTDGRYVYMHSAKNPELPFYEYTLMPTHMRKMFQPEELQDIELTDGFSFTKGCKVMKIRGLAGTGNTNSFGSALYDLKLDPAQTNPIEDESVTSRMKDGLVNYMVNNDAPAELYQRLGLNEQRR